jgi:hypothetical protein
MTQAAPTQAIDKAEHIDIEAVSVAVEEALSMCSPSSLVELPALSQAVSLAKGIISLRKALSPEIMKHVFMPLQGSPLGFLADKTYDEQTVRECLIQAMIMGLRPINNEFNIIGGKAYAAKNGCERIVRSWPGLSALTIDLSVPQMAGDKGAMVAVRASWLLSGKRCEYSRQQSKTEDGEIFDNRIAVRVNAGMGADAIHGKAYRKTYKGILDLLSNGALSIDDADAIETVGVAVPQAQLPEGRRMSLGEAKKAPREPGDEG